MSSKYSEQIKIYFHDIDPEVKMLKTNLKNIVIMMMVLLLPVFAQSYKIVDTNQNTCYDNDSEINAPSKGDAFYGQDAQFQGNQPSYLDNGDGTVTDLNTGLMWQQNLPDAKYEWADCVTYADTSTLAGYTDWRLPTIKEIYSLMLFSGKTGMNEVDCIPYINTDYFDFRFGNVVDPSERIIDAQYATSTIYKGTTMGGNETMFGLNLVDGRIKGYPTFKTFEIRMVRGSTTYGVNDFVDNGDGTVTDNATGLMWDRDGSSTGMNWHDALAYAQEKNDENYLGYNDWRVPNAKELHSIVDYDRSPSYTNSAAIDEVFNVPQITDEAGETDYPWYWTSTTHYDGPMPDKAVYICFGKALGYFMNEWQDVHGAGAQRSDYKEGDASDYPEGHGPQGDAIRILNYVRLVRDTEIDTTASNNPDPSGNTEGVTLFSPMNSTTSYLIDSDGGIVNRWDTDYKPAASAYLLADSSLLRTGSLGSQISTVFSDGAATGGVVERYSWDGTKLWEFEYSGENYIPHHDIEYMPNGNILMIVWERKTQTEATDAGRDPSLLSDGELWPDEIIEVQPTGSSGGNIVWEWHTWDHLVQDYDVSKENYGVVADHPEKININFVHRQPGKDWTHTNSVDYNEDLDQILLTVHNFSEIWIIDHNTTTAEAAGEKGDLLYRWGNPQTYDQGTANDQMLFVPHDAEWIASGLPGENDILIFNNGQGRSDGDYSSVDQITPPVDQNGNYTKTGNTYGPAALTWTYQGNPKTDFYADHISGAQRLPDGNTLICNGTAGKFFEINASREKRWEYTNPYSVTTPQGDEMKEVFRATRYYLEELTGLTTPTEPTDVEDSVVPTNYTLNQNYPNPFNPSTNISFSIPNSSQVSLSIYNILGELITRLVDKELSAGNYNYTFNADNLASGVYIYSLSVDGKNMGIKKMLLLR